MDPAKSNKIILILDIKEFFLVQGLARVCLSLLLGDDDVSDQECILGLHGGG